MTGVLPRFTPRYFALQASATVKLSTGLSWEKEQRLSKLSLRWWADIQVEISARHAEIHVTTWVSEAGKEKIS